MYRSRPLCTPQVFEVHEIRGGGKGKPPRGEEEEASGSTLGAGSSCLRPYRPSLGASGPSLGAGSARLGPYRPSLGAGSARAAVNEAATRGIERASHCHRSAR
jgi:hypothetical protein